MLNVLDVVYNYSLNGKLLDEEIIKKILVVTLMENNIDPNEIQFINTKTRFLFNSKVATYINKKIYFDYNKIKRYLNNCDNLSDFKCETNLSKFEFLLRKNLFILEIILHEVEHVIQSKNKNLTLEDNLVNAELDYVENLDKIYKDKTIPYLERHSQFNEGVYQLQRNYDISFMERMANINSCNKVLEITDKIKKEHKYLNELKKYELIDNKMKNYNKVSDMPTIRFFINIGKYQDIAEYDMVNLTEEEKLTLGLRINPETYYNNMRILSMNKKRVISK